MKNRKYKLFLIVSTAILIVWLLLVFKFPIIGNTVLLPLGTLLIFIFLITIEINRGILIDLLPNQIKQIWWSRVLKNFIISFFVTILIVYRNNSIANIVEILVNSAAFGIILGYWLRRFEEKSKTQEESRQFIVNLQVEVSENRFKCQAIIKNWEPLFLQTSVWDSLKTSKHFRLLWKKEGLTNKLYNLYLLISSANFKVNQTHWALYAVINEQDTHKKQSASAIEVILKRFLKNELLPKLQEMEKELEEFSKAAIHR